MQEMIINRYNYQEYFLLYTDNELNATERKHVEDFVQQNPDLAEELQMLTDAVFAPDEEVVFENKELLFQFDNGKKLIHPGNFEEFAVRFSDNELTADDKAHLERFLIENPNFQQEFELIQSLKLVADDSLTFPDKASLYRHEKDRKPVVLPWWRLAAAAVVLVFLGGLWYTQHQTKVLQPNLAEVTPSRPAQIQKQVTTTTNSGLPTIQANANTGPKDIAVTKPAPVTIARPANVGEPVHQQNIAAAQKASVNDKTKAQAVSTSNDIARVTNTKPDNSGINTADVQLPASAKVADNQAGSGNNSKNTASLGTSIEKASTHMPNSLEVTLNPDKANTLSLATAVANNEMDEDISNSLAERKSPLRGLIRKASRFIDKTTSSRTSKRSGLLIGNIEIALQ